MQALYTTEVTAHGGRDGKVKSADGVLDLKLEMPKALGGSGAAAANPETLFGAGYAACFEGALRLVARLEKKPVEDASIRAKVTLYKADDGGFQLGVELIGKVAGRSREEAQALMEKAHAVCPYSKATRGNVEVKLSVE